MDRLHIIRLQLDGLEVVLLSLGQVIGFIPAESSVVVRFEMIRVEFDSSAIICNGSIKVALLAVCEASVMVKICLSWLYLDGGRETLDGFVEVTASVERDAFIVVRVGILRVDLDRCSVVLNCRAKLTKFVIGKTSIKKRLKVVRVDLESFGIEGDSRFVVTLLTCSVALSMELLGLSLELRIDLHLLWSNHRLSNWLRSLGCLNGFSNIWLSIVSTRHHVITVRLSSGNLTLCHSILFLI